MPVYVGQIDDLLLPFCDGVSDAELVSKLRFFWRYLDRVLPDAFVHANIGPADNRVARAVLAVDAELKQIAPNLTFRYDPGISGDAILRFCTANIIACSKPHIANHPLHRAAFDGVGYGDGWGRWFSRRGGGNSADLDAGVCDPPSVRLRLPPSPARGEGNECRHHSTPFVLGTASPSMRMAWRRARPKAL